MASYTDDGESLKLNVAFSMSTGFMCRHASRLHFGSDKIRVPDRLIRRNRLSRFITKYLIGELRRVCGWFPLCVTHEWSGSVGFRQDEFPIVGVMDGRLQYVIAGMSGLGTAVSFNAASCACNSILNLTGTEEDYPEEFFAPSLVLDPKQHPSLHLNRVN